MEHITKISFPGLGIPEFEINATAFTLFGKFPIQWYGLIITCGIALALFYCAYRAKQEGIKFDDLLDIAIFTIIFGVIGARAGYVLFSLDDYIRSNLWDTLLAMIDIRSGGLQIYGAIIAGAITIFVVCAVKKINPIKMLDAVGPAVMIGQFIGRWGNFCNGEAHGSEVLKGNPLYFLRMGLYPHIEDGKRVYEYAEVHPTFFYESLWNIIGFVLINFLYKKKKFNGQIVLMYLTWYGFGRMLIEMLRTDSLTLGKTGIRVSVVIGAVCFVCGATLLIVNFILAHKAKKNGIEFVQFYEKIFLCPVAAKVNENVVSERDEENNAESAENISNSTEDTSDKSEIEKKFNDIFNGDNENKDDKGE